MKYNSKDSILLRLNLFEIFILLKIIRNVVNLIANTLKTEKNRQPTNQGLRGFEWCQL